MEYKVIEISQNVAELYAGLKHKEYFSDKVSDLKPNSRRLREILAVRCLIKDMIGYEKRVEYDEDGRPALDDRYISISHTDGYATVALSETPVGIDIERVGKKVEKVTSRFMQIKEINLAKSFSSDKIYNLCLHLIWSAKEAIYKVLGKEYYDLQNLTFVEEIDFKNEIMYMRVNGKDKPFPIHFKYTEDYVLCFLILD